MWPLMFSSDTTKDLVIFPVCVSAKVRKHDSIVSNISHLFVTKVIIYYLPNYEIRESDTNKVTKLNQQRDESVCIFALVLAAVVGLNSQFFRHTTSLVLKHLV